MVSTQQYLSASGFATSVRLSTIFCRYDSRYISDNCFCGSICYIFFVFSIITSLSPQAWLSAYLTLLTYQSKTWLNTNLFMCVTWLCLCCYTRRFRICSGDRQLSLISPVGAVLIGGCFTTFSRKQTLGVVCFRFRQLLHVSVTFVDSTRYHRHWLW